MLTELLTQVEPLYRNTLPVVGDAIFASLQDDKAFEIELFIQDVPLNFNNWPLEGLDIFTSVVRPDNAEFTAGTVEFIQEVPVYFKICPVTGVEILIPERSP